MLPIVNGVLDGFGQFLKGLGWGGTFVLFLFLIFGILVLNFASKALRIVNTTIKSYRRLPVLGKQIVWLGIVAVSIRVFWPFLPKTTMFLAVLVAVGVGFTYGGIRLADRYGLGDVYPWEAWIHHWEMAHTQRGLTRAIEDTTGKKNGRSRKPVATATGFDAVLEPPDQMSAEAFADAINNGEMAPAVARREGWGQVKGMKATAQPDHTVWVHVDRVDAEAGELLADVEEWVP